MRSVLVCVALFAALAAASNCDLQAQLQCARKGCAGFQVLSGESVDLCRYSCDRCDGANKKAIGIMNIAQFSSPDCTGDATSLNSTLTGQCLGYEFVSCTKDACFRRQYSKDGCKNLYASDATHLNQCIPDGFGGSLMSGSLLNLPAHRPHFNGETACPYKDVEKLKCAIAILECVSDCFGGIESCLECITGAVGAGKAQMCCQTLSYYVGFDCTDCNDFKKKQQ
jgi:hypothetical protein